MTFHFYVLVDRGRALIGNAWWLPKMGYFLFHHYKPHYYHKMGMCLM